MLILTYLLTLHPVRRLNRGLILTCYLVTSSYIPDRLVSGGAEGHRLLPLGVPPSTIKLISNLWLCYT